MSLLYSKSNMVKIMGFVNSIKTTYNKEHYTEVKDRHNDLHKLYDEKKYVKRQIHKPTIKLCTLKPTPIRSK